MPAQPGGCKGVSTAHPSPRAAPSLVPAGLLALCQTVLEVPPQQHLLSPHSCRSRSPRGDTGHTLTDQVPKVQVLFAKVSSIVAVRI